MRFLAHLINAFKLTKLTYPYKNAVTYSPVAIGGDNKTQKRLFASKTSGGELNNCDESFQEAFAILSLLRDNSLQVELFADNLEELKTDCKKDGKNENSTIKNVITAADIQEPETKNSLGIRGGITQQNLVNSPPIHFSKDIHEIPSSSMEISNLKKSLLNSRNFLSSKPSTLFLSTNTRLEPYDTTTIPLHLNTLINGTDVGIDTKRNSQYQLQSLKVPEFNEYLTSLAANLCSAAFQNGLSSERCRKYYCTDKSFDPISIQKQVDKKNDPSSEKIVEDLLKKYDEFQNEMNALATSSTVASKETKTQKRDPHIVCVRDGKKGCISPGNAENPPYISKKITELDIPQEAKSVSNGLGLLDPQLYKKSLKEAEKRRKELAKASASSKEKLSLRACQSKKSIGSENKDPCKSMDSKCADSFATSKCGPEIESSLNNFERVTEPSSPFKCGGSSKTAKSKCGSEKRKDSKSESSSCRSSESKDPCKMLQSSNQKSKCNSKKKLSTCKSEHDFCDFLPKMSDKQNQECKSKSEKVEPKCSFETKSDCESKKLSESKDSSKKPSKRTKCVATNRPSEKKTSKKECSKTEKKSMKSVNSTEASKCTQKPKAKSETSRISKKCGSSTGIEDPCKVPSITFNKSSEKSASASKCPDPPKPKCQTNSKEEKPTPNGAMKKSASASKCSEQSNPKCEASKEEKPLPCRVKKSASASKFSPKTDMKASICSSKCSSNSCVTPQKEPSEDDSEKACKRVSMDAKPSCGGSEPKNPCKSRCDSMNKPKSKCGRPPRGDTRPKCKKGSSCGSKKPSPCASKEKLEPKCGTEMKTPSEKPPKCAKKTCAPSPKPSKIDEFKPKSTCSTGHSKPKSVIPSSEPPKRKLHSLSNFSMVNLIFRRNFSDDCPEKPKGGYKLETERSDEYRRETCDNFSWKATKPRKKRVNKPKNCYPDETLEFCPDTACYKVYAETSGKSNKKKGKKKPKATKMEKNEALCTKRTISPFDYNQKRNLSSKAGENEEALIQKPHSVCTRKLILPEMSDNDALICVDSVALSDTDIHMFETGGRHTPELTLGNEAAGIITEVGRSICNLKPGDHVVLESGIPCFKCDLCKMGHYNICNNISFRGFLKNQCIHPASFCHKICPPIPLDQAALIPQLAMGCNACYQACIKPNANVAIIGSCAKTVCATMCAISMGAENVCVICGMPETRILIEQFVTQKVDSFDANTIEKGIVRTILSSLGTFPDIIINFSACTKTMNASIMALKPAGVCVVAGFLSECVSYNIMDALMKEIRIIPSFRSKNMFPKAIHLLESGRAPLDCLIANCELCKWSELEGAFKLALSEGNNGPRKAIVRCHLRGNEQ